MRTKTADGAPGLAWPGAILPLRRGRFSARVELRSVVVTALVVVGALGCAVWSLTLGSAGLGASGSLATSLGALAGGVLTGVVVYLFAYQRGVTGVRIIVVGIGVSLFLGAFNTWLLTTMRVERAMLLIGVALVAVVTASAGPIAFVALAAPQLAMRLGGTPGVRILPSAALGALLLLASDMVARTVLAPTQLPVGVVTLCVGGAYLVWLLASQGKRNR